MIDLDQTDRALLHALIDDASQSAGALRPATFFHISAASSSV